jgi:hypothetical protein
MSYRHTVSAATIAVSMMLFCAVIAAQSGTTPSASQTLKPPEGTNEPVPTRPDPDGGENKAALIVQRDLALIGVFRLGSVDIPWGNTVVVSTAQAAFKANGKCRFNYRYRTRNIGGVVTLPTQNWIHLQEMTGQVLSNVPLQALLPNATAASTGTITLTPGTWMLYVQADATTSVPESDEANNLRRVRVTISGGCG